MENENIKMDFGTHDNYKITIKNTTLQNLLNSLFNVNHGRSADLKLLN
jgi:hypothetical protein